MNNIERYLEFGKKGDKESTLADYRKIVSTLFEIFKADEKTIDQFKKKDLRLDKDSFFTQDISLHSKELGVENGDFRVFLGYDAPSLDEAYYDIAIGTWYLKGVSELYTQFLYRLIHEFDFPYINGHGQQGESWPTINSPDDPPEKIIKRLSGETGKRFDIHYFSKEYAQEKFGGDLSFIPFKDKFDLGKGWLFTSQYFKDSTRFDASMREINPEKSTLYEKVVSMFKEHQVEAKPEDLTEIGIVDISKMKRGKYAEIEFNCPHCQAKGKLNVNAEFFRQEATCPDCREKGVKFKLLKEWVV